MGDLSICVYLCIWYMYTRRNACKHIRARIICIRGSVLRIQPVGCNCIRTPTVTSDTYHTVRRCGSRMLRSSNMLRVLCGAMTLLVASALQLPQAAPLACNVADIQLGGDMFNNVVKAGERKASYSALKTFQVCVPVCVWAWSEFVVAAGGHRWYTHRLRGTVSYPGTSSCYPCI
jgi:hypothetical protein